MTIYRDVLGFLYDDAVPSFLTFADGNVLDDEGQLKFYYHRPSRHLVDRDDIHDLATQKNHTWQPNEIGHWPLWLYPNTGLGENPFPPEHHMTWPEGDALRMRWMGNWTMGREYVPNDVVVDNNWLAVATVNTTERAAPSEVGYTEWFLPDDPEWTVIEDESTAVVVGLHVIADEAIKISKIRAWMRPGFVYDVYLVPKAGLLPAQEGNRLQLLAAGIKVAVEGWKSAAVPTSIFLAGAAFEVFIIITVDPDVVTPTFFTGSWDYQKPGAPQAPQSGQCLHAGDLSGHLYFHKTDKNGVDHSANFELIQPGTIVSAGSSVWTIMSAVDAGTYMDATITPSVQDNSTGQKDFSFEVPQTSLLSHVRLPNYYVGNPLIYSFYSLTGYYNAETTKNGAGVDIETTPVAASRDWDLMAYSGATGGVDTGGDALLALQSKVDDMEARLAALESPDGQGV